MDTHTLQVDSVVRSLQYSNPVMNAFETFVARNGFQFFLEWRATGEDELKWDPAADPKLRLIIRNEVLSQPNCYSTLYIEETSTAAYQIDWVQGRINSLIVAALSEDKLAIIREKFGYIQEDIIKPSVKFWYLRGHNANWLSKNIEVPMNETILRNYGNVIQEDLNKLLNIKIHEDSASGRLILFRGNPGTGKTYFIRYMMHRWKKWCNFHYITDPENFFQEPSYLL